MTTVSISSLKANLSRYLRVPGLARFSGAGRQRGPAGGRQTPDCRWSSPAPLGIGRIDSRSPMVAASLWRRTGPTGWRYWDASALVPLIEPGNVAQEDDHVVTWAWTRTEITSAIERRARRGADPGGAADGSRPPSMILAAGWDEIIAARPRPGECGAGAAPPPGRRCRPPWRRPAGERAALGPTAVPLPRSAPLRRRRSAWPTPAIEGGGCPAAVSVARRRRRSHT